MKMFPYIPSCNECKGFERKKKTLKRTVLMAIRRILIELNTREYEIRG
jgi:hypothetical protein